MNISTQDTTIATAELSTLITDANTAAIARAAAKLAALTSINELERVIADALMISQAALKAKTARRQLIADIEQQVLQCTWVAITSQIGKQGHLKIDATSSSRNSPLIHKDIAERTCIQLYEAVRADSGYGDINVHAEMQDMLASCFTDNGSAIPFVLTFSNDDGDDAGYCNHADEFYMCCIPYLDELSDAELVDVHDLLIAPMLMLGLHGDETQSENQEQEDQ